ncbi:hypothetical protein [Streptomyces sp. NPDC003832]
MLAAACTAHNCEPLRATCPGWYRRYQETRYLVDDPELPQRIGMTPAPSPHDQPVGNHAIPLGLGNGKGRLGAVLTGALALLLILTGCAGAGESTSASAPDRSPRAAVPIRDLHDRFISDRSRAERECYGRSVTVRAVVLNTGASEFGTPTIEASDVANGPRLASIVLPYDDRRAESFRRLESVETGQEITATATCNVFVDDDRVLIFKNADITEGSGKP